MVSRPHGDSTQRGKKQTGVPGRNKCPMPRDYGSQRKKGRERGRELVLLQSYDRIAVMVTETKATEKAIKDG